jgi:hypothetical protein
VIFYFAGAEIPGHRKLLNEQGIQHTALSFMGLRRRVKHTELWSIATHFTGSVLLDSGGHTLNREGVEMSKNEIEDICVEYDQFLSMRENDNLGAVDRFIEFDPLVMGKEWIAERREEPLFQEKGIAVWHEQWGVDELKRMADNYEYIAVGQGTCGDRDIVPVLRSMARSGVKFHGMGFSSPPLMLALTWASVSSTTWISAASHGETMVWTGTELKRYPARYKAQARKRHRTLFDSNGLDAAAIEADDPTENLKLSLWSWSQQIAAVNQHQIEAVTPNAKRAETATGENGEGVVETMVSETQNDDTTHASSDRRKRLLPGIETEAFVHRYTDPESGERKSRTEHRLSITDLNVRVCDGCFLKEKCPEYEPGESCVYEIPVRVRTKEQYMALLDSIIAMSAARVFSMRMSEEVEGGYADPNLSTLIDQMARLIKLKAALEEASFSFSLKVQQNGHAEAGILSRLFGSEAVAPRAIENRPAVPVDQALADLGIADVLDAEVIDAD